MKPRYILTGRSCPPEFFWTHQYSWCQHGYHYHYAYVHGRIYEYTLDRRRR